MQPNNAFGAQKAVAMLKWQYARVFAFVAAISFLTIWNFLVGAVFLILRQLGYLNVDFLIFSLAGLPIAILAAAAVARRKLADQHGWLALIDSCNRSGGLMLATGETGDDSWSDRLPANFVLPEFRPANQGRYFSLAISFLFLLLCLYLPVVPWSGASDPRIDLKGLEQTAAEQIELLAKEGVLSVEEAKELSRSLERIANDSNSTDPAATFEALDQLQEKLKKQASANALKMASELDNLGKLEALADKLSEAGRQNRDDISELASSLSKNLESGDSAEALSGAGDTLKKALEKAANGGPDSAEAAQQAASELKEYIRQAAEKATAASEKLAKARLIDRKTFEELKKAGKIRPATEADLQPGSQSELVVAPADGCEAGGESSANGNNQGQKKGVGVKDGDGVGASGMAGRDGGTAPLNFNRKTSEHDVEFKDQVLPAPGEHALEQSVAIGMSLSAPQVEPEDGGGANLSPTRWQKPSESSAESGIILPKHRSAVKKYFDHEHP